MAEASKIEWCDSTFNPWIFGCTAIAPACDFCYAEAMARRYKWAQWGDFPRHRTSEAMWKEPLKWQRQAAAFLAEHGHRRRVFCASLADVFDNQVDPAWRDDLWDLIRATPDLDWLLLTKRPQNIAKMKPAFWDEVKGHVWLGTTVEDQKHAGQNIPHLLEHDSAVRFISVEPMLGPIDLTNLCAPDPDTNGWSAIWVNNQIGRRWIDWVIAGGESGPNASPSDPRWFRSLREQCEAAGVPFLFKQWGCWVPAPDGMTQDEAFNWAQLNRHGRMSRPTEAWGGSAGSITEWHNWPGQLYSFPATKARAGRLLDGREHNDMPQMSSEALVREERSAWPY